MIEYIYIVKCPGREDEMFNFFTDARMQCDLLMSKKPIITQVEVERNDFGECTDSHDLGTVWSWEEAMKDTEDGYTEAEPTKAIFTKDDLKRMANGEDPEFDDIDNSVDFEPETSEVSAIDEVPDNFRKPIPEGMTIEQLVEEMEENEDTVECTWCNDLFDKSECRKEVDLGWLCSRCEMAIKSRGETLTFREGSYWDFLDEDITTERSIEELVRDSINHLVNDLGKDSDAEDFADDVILDIERNYDNFVPETPENHSKWASAIACEVSRQLNEKLDIDIDFSQVIDSSDMEIWGVEPVGDATYKAVLLKRFENVPFRGGRGEIEKVESEMFDIGGLFVFHFGKDGLPELGRWDPELLNSLGNCEIIFDDERYDRACEETLNKSTSQTKDLDPETLHDLGNTYDGGYPAEDNLTEAEELAEKTFDRLEKVELYYDDIGGGYEYVTDKDAITDVFVDLVADEDVQQLSNGRWQAVEEINVYDYDHHYIDSEAYPVHEWTAFLENNYDALFAKYEDEVYKALRADAKKQYLKDREEREADNYWLDYADHVYHSRRDAEFD